MGLRRQEHFDVSKEFETIEVQIVSLIIRGKCMKRVILLLVSFLMFFAFTGCIIHIKETPKKDKPSNTHVIINEKGKKVIIHEKD